MTTEVGSPFGDEWVEEVALNPAPLVKVLAQLKFPVVMSIAQDAYISSFQERLRKRYPVLRPETSFEAIMIGDGVQQQIGRIWRFFDLDAEWSVGLGTNFVALETSSYVSRDDFIERLREVFEALDAMAEPGPVAIADRLGVRYINRLTGEDATTRLGDLICHAMFGPLTMEMPEGMDFPASIGQAHFKLNGPQMQARWGKLPPDAGFLPDIPVVPEPSWMLDIDVFIDGPFAFDVDKMTDMAKHAANQAYRFFRWTMTETFIKERRAK